MTSTENNHLVDKTTNQAIELSRAMGAVMEVVLKSNAEMAPILAAIQSRTSEVISFASTVSKVLSKFVTSIDFELIRRITSFPFEQRKAFAACHPRLVNHGWLMLYWMPADLVSQINNIPDSELQKDIDALYFELICEDGYAFFDRLLGNIHESLIMRRYLPTVRTAVDLFKNSKQVGLRNYHRAIIPSLLPVLDGSRIKLARKKFRKDESYREFVEAERQMVLNNTSKHGKVNFQNVIKEDVSRAESIIRSSSGNSCWLGASELITNVFDNKILDHPILNRNAVLHGRNTKYALRSNSIRLFMLINFLLEVESELPSIDEYSEKDIFLR